MTYVIYNEEGRILRNISCPPSMIEAQLSEGEDYIESQKIVDDTLFYVQNLFILQRPLFSEFVEGTTITNLPVPTTLLVEGTSYETTDGIAELSFSIPGTYSVTLQSFPYQDKTIGVTQE
jgi:hypothetical protein